MQILFLIIYANWEVYLKIVCGGEVIYICLENSLFFFH